MPVRKYKSRYDGREYSDTAAGWLADAKNEWADKLKKAGHRMTWRKTGKAAYEGRCNGCGGSISVGSSWSSSPGPDILRSRLLPGIHARRCRTASATCGSGRWH